MPASLARRPTAVALIACLGAAGLSFLLEPFALLPDPWAWVVWGRELLGLELDTTSGPSWKPLPVLVVAALSLAQGAAPALWVLVARAGGLLAFVMAWRVARRLAGPGAGWIAAVALAIALAPSWMNIVAMGREEGLLCALILWAVERHLAGRAEQALVLGFAAALLRPEAWPFFALYGLWLVFGRPLRTILVPPPGRPRRLLLVATLSVALLPLWFLPDIVTVGDPLQSSQKAQGGISGTTLTEPVKRAYELVPPALQLAALGAAAMAFVAVRRMGLRAALRGRAPELTVLALFAGALGWVALVAVTSKLANYAGIARFQHPAAAVVCVLAGVGAAWLTVLAREALQRRRPSAPAGALAAALVGAVLLAATLPTLPTRVRRVDRVVKEEQARAELDGTLGDAVAAAGGRERLVACGSSYTNAGNEPALAWHLDRHIDQVSSDTPRVPGAVVRVYPQALRSEEVRRLAIGLFPVRDRTFDPVARAGVWEVLTACRSGTR